MTKKAEILKLFYRTELYPGEIIVDNSSSFIAKKVGTSLDYVNEVLDKELKNKYK